jgi:hypothetical protein
MLLIHVVAPHVQALRPASPALDADDARRKLLQVAA